MTQLIVAAEPAELARRAARWLVHEVIQNIAERGSCTLCLSGGRTPEPTYRTLASDTGIDWSKVYVFFGDERAVPPNHPDSNYLMVHQALLSRVPIPSANVHRMEAERADREAAAREYEQSLPAHLDLLLLGMGPDGHTASLFPGSAALDERQRRVIAVRATKPPEERLTITPPVIEAARKVALIVTGDDKAEMVARAIEGRPEPREVPAQWARRAVWFLDRAAAKRLTTRTAAT